MLRSYSSPYALGHKATECLWDGIVWAEEKIDGSQFSFGRIGDEWHCRSRKQDLSHTVDDPAAAGMFKLAIETIVRLDLHDGWVYRGEFLAKPKHNTLAYARVPKGNIILFDVDQSDQDYLDPYTAAGEAERLGLEFVPILGEYGGTTAVEDLKQLLVVPSVLGRTDVEGIVLKNYGVFDQSQKKVLMAKLVSADFQEAHQKDSKRRNPSKQDITD